MEWMERMNRTMDYIEENLSGRIDPEQIAAQNSLANQLKYSLIIVSCGPILLVYPFVQRYFVKGVMLGSIKG